MSHLLWCIYVRAAVKGKWFDDFAYAVKAGGLMCFSVREDVADDPSYHYNEKGKSCAVKRSGNCCLN